MGLAAAFSILNVKSRDDPALMQNYRRLALRCHPDTRDRYSDSELPELLRKLEENSRFPKLVVALELIIHGKQETELEPLNFVAVRIPGDLIREEVYVESACWAAIDLADNHIAIVCRCKEIQFTQISRAFETVQCGGCSQFYKLISEEKL